MASGGSILDLCKQSIPLVGFSQTVRRSCVLPIADFFLGWGYIIYVQPSAAAFCLLLPDLHATSKMPKTAMTISD